MSLPVFLDFVRQVLRMILADDEIVALGDVRPEVAFWRV